MSFVTWQYLAFLAASLCVVRLMRGKGASRVFLLIASCAFYGFFEVRLVPVLLAMAGVSFLAARYITRAPDPRSRRAGLTVGIGLNLGVLGLFKYYDFFAESIAAALRVPNPVSLGLVLPVGISFITFEVLSYMINVYRGELEAASLTDLALMVMFFPHIVADPIRRPADFLPQLTRRLDVSWTNVELAVPGFLLGVVKKVLIADSLALFVNPVFARPGFYSSYTVWLAE